MATIKVTSSKNGSIKSLIEYLTQEEKTQEHLVSGKDCYAKKVVRDFMTTKQLFNKKGGRQYHHYVQSFKPGEVTPDKAHELGRELAEDFQGFEVFIVTHVDKEHIHNHLVVNSVNFNNGKKLHTSKYDLEQFKKLNDKICRRENLNVIENKKGRYLSQAQVHLIKKGQSKQVDLIAKILKAKNGCRSKEKYIEIMDQQGYTVEWGSRNRITYIDKDLKKKNDEQKAVGKKGVKYKFGERALSKYIDVSKITKEELENEFERNDRRGNQYKDERSGWGESISRDEESTSRQSEKDEQNKQSRDGKFITEGIIGNDNGQLQSLSNEERGVHGGTETKVRNDGAKGTGTKNKRRYPKSKHQNRGREYQ